MNTPETMTKHDFSDLTPPKELRDEWRGKHVTVNLNDLEDRAARWGAEQAAERLKGQWPTPIADRAPTEADGDSSGTVQFISPVGVWSQCHWSHAVCPSTGKFDPWRHTPRWQPPAPPTLKEQALKLLQPEGMPARVFNEDQLSLLRRALEADS